MRVLLINAVCGTGSTGRICWDIARDLEACGDEVRIAYGRDDAVPDECHRYAVRIGGGLGVKVHALMTRLFDRHGTGPCSLFATRRFLRWADGFDPDLVWLHNLHGYYINFEALFVWIKSRPAMKVRWNIHDCWNFTGHCTHFQKTGCDRWLSGCHDCPEKSEYPKSLWLDNSRGNYAAKRRAFLGVKDMTLVTPSEWLADLVRRGFLGSEYPVEVVPHPYDRETFRPTPSDIRARLGLEGMRMVLCVASQWDDCKGWDDVLALARLADERTRIVVVGLSDAQMRSLPPNVTGMARTSSKRELAELYTAADCLFNPTKEDIYSMTNLEAAACGCRVVTYDTGGAPEAIKDFANKVVLSDRTPAAAWAAISAT